jgi:hypothetical protein
MFTKPNMLSDKALLRMLGWRWTGAFTPGPGDYAYAARQVAFGMALLAAAGGGLDSLEPKRRELLAELAKRWDLDLSQIFESVT